MTAVRPLAAHRRFFAWAEHAGRAHGHLVEAASYEAAAVGYAELYSPAPIDGGEVRIHVAGVDDHRQHCFLVDLDDAAARVC
ncbi:DUF5961 family protein [Brevundimonas sp. Root1279]|uniref:DUF5961 family protein n=1 Tax=Brevundimonas sp. Root1279 TaxID=1736443 RepID=UPI0006F68463|nr:DUF5961 family protein [Brevundimonas sp. Root1279]KQW81975.1 hypothetical protein ASC65_11890 [Brevundimonas sp. Root1279]